MSTKTQKLARQADLARNRAAAHEYHLLKRLEAGIVLSGPEVKSARLGRVNLKDGFARIVDGEALLCGVHISPYTHAHDTDYDPLRPRKLLLHAREIRKLERETRSAGMTLVPTRLYLKAGKIKVEIALAKGKRAYDKRETARQKVLDREIERARDR